LKLLRKNSTLLTYQFRDKFDRKVKGPE